MKKFFIIGFVLLISVLLISACGNEDMDTEGISSAKSSNQGSKDEGIIPKDEYELTVEGNNSLLYEALKKSYKAGEHIFVKTKLVMDANAVVKLNGENPISKRTVQNEEGRYLYNEHEFVMPAKNSVISLSVAGGMGVLEYSLTVNDKYGDLFEMPKDFYAAGETVTVKTHIIHDAEVVVELNGAKPLQRRLVKGEEGEYIYEEWEFIMPQKDSLLTIFSRPGMDAVYYDINVIDPDNLVVNQLSGMYAHGESFEIHAMMSDLEITVNDEPLQASPEAILNDRGEVLYYSWSGFELTCDITVSVLVRATAG